MAGDEPLHGLIIPGAPPRIFGKSVAWTSASASSMCARTGLIPGRISTTDWGRLVTLRTVASIPNGAQPEDGLGQPFELLPPSTVRGAGAPGWENVARQVLRLSDRVPRGRNPYGDRLRQRLPAVLDLF